MIGNRLLNWDGCINVRDLGGLTTNDGRATRWGAVVRSDHPARLTAAGWLALRACGIHTIISLCTDGIVEEELDRNQVPADITMIRTAVEDFNDTVFVQKWVDSDLWCTPLYYRDALERWPERYAAVVAAVAHAQPGGVLVHCGRGNDRTGIVTILLLALVGVTSEDIVLDYELSPDPQRKELLDREHTSARDTILDLLAWLDNNAYLLGAGVSQDDLEKVRVRLLEPPG